jgi:hypothetical protein
LCACFDPTVKRWRRRGRREGRREDGVNLFARCSRTVRRTHRKSNRSIQPTFSIWTNVLCALANALRSIRLLLSTAHAIVTKQAFVAHSQRSGSSYVHFAHSFTYSIHLQSSKSGLCNGRSRATSRQQQGSNSQSNGNIALRATLQSNSETRAEFGCP